MPDSRLRVDATSTMKGKDKTNAEGKDKAKWNTTEGGLLPSGRRVHVPYSPEETLCLADNWVAIFEDPTKGNDQTAQFWLQIHARYNQRNDREEFEMLKSHWKIAQAKIREFNNYYCEAKVARPSGATESDIYDNASRKYSENNNAPFL